MTFNTEMLDLNSQVTLTHFGTVLGGNVWDRMLGMELRGGGWTSALWEGTAGSGSEGTNFLSGVTCESRKIQSKQI